MVVCLLDLLNLFLFQRQNIGVNLLGVRCGTDNLKRVFLKDFD